MAGAFSPYTWLDLAAPVMPSPIRGLYKGARRLMQYGQPSGGGEAAGGGTVAEAATQQGSPYPQPPQVRPDPDGPEATLNRFQNINVQGAPETIEEKLKRFQNINPYGQQELSQEEADSMTGAMPAPKPPSPPDPREGGDAPREWQNGKLVPVQQQMAPEEPKGGGDMDVDQIARMAMGMGAQQRYQLANSLPMQKRVAVMTRMNELVDEGNARRARLYGGGQPGGLQQLMALYRQYQMMGGR